MSLRFFLGAIAIGCLSIPANAGFVEICKDSFPAGSLSGLFSFTIAGQTGTIQVPVGACTPSFQLPDGVAVITELPRAGALLFAIATFPDNRLISFNLPAGSATVQIVPGDLSAGTVVFFTNTLDTRIPEPGTAWLLGSGLTVWALRRNPRKRRAYSNEAGVG